MEENNKNNLETLSDLDIAFGTDNSNEEIEVLSDFNSADVSNSMRQDNNQNINNNVNSTEINNMQRDSQNIQEQSTIQVPVENENLQNTTSNFEVQNNVEMTNTTNNLQNNISSEQPVSNNINFGTSNEEESKELLKAYIGKNYEKITTRKFNFAGAFFGALYMFYRKMFGYAIIVFLINLTISSVISNVIKNSVLNFVISILLGVIVGIFVNNIYVKFSNQKINKIKSKNPSKNIDELKSICANKGGTSIGYIFLGIITEIVMAIIIAIIMTIFSIGTMFGQIIKFPNLKDWNTTVDTTNSTLVENVNITGYSCVGKKCTISVSENNEDVDYNLKTNNDDLLRVLNDYKDYINVNIYYSQSGENKFIVDFKIYSKSNNEEIDNTITENELREKLGLYSEGTHTESLTLVRIGNLGAGYSQGETYSYITYTFKNKLNTEYEMDQKNPSNPNNLIVGNDYKVTFEVKKGAFDYEFNIIKIEQ